MTLSRTLVSLLVCVSIVLATASVGAHGTGQHILGTVTAVSDTQLDVTTQKGQALTVRVNEKTEFRPRGKDTSGTRPQVGDRVVIEASGKGADLTATEVLFASPKGKAKAQ